VTKREPSGSNTARVNIAMSTYPNENTGTLIIPDVTTSHVNYYFYTYVEAKNNYYGVTTSSGYYDSIKSVIGSHQYFGPYTLKVGCQAEHVTYSDSSSNTWSFSANVGDLAAN
jgi:hypothetical protein